MAMPAQRITAARTVTVFLLVSGCSGKPGDKAAAGLMNVEVGMSETQVLALMGQPQRRESHGGTEFLIYATDDRSTTALLNFIPIAMVDGRVTGIGRHVYDHVVRAKTRSDKNPEPGPDSHRR